MRSFVVDCWNHIMDAEINPLRNIPDLTCKTHDHADFSIYVVGCICYYDRRQHYGIWY